MTFYFEFDCTCILQLLLKHLSYLLPFIYIFVEQVYKKLLGYIINMISCILCYTRAVVDATTKAIIDILIQ